MSQEGDDSFTAAVIIKTKQINHQYAYGRRAKQLYCAVNWRPQTYFRGVKPEKLKISPQIATNWNPSNLLVLFFNQLKA